MFEQIMKIMDTNFTGISEIFVNSTHEEEKSGSFKESIKTIIKVRNWRNDDIGTSNSKVYIKRFNCSPVTCEISFYSTLTDEENIDKQEGRSVL